MATRILAMDLNIPMRNWEEIDVSVDEMIMRVFLRAGLSATYDPAEIIAAARQLNPSFPGALDYPCWMIGRQWCQPLSPDCGSCYIGNACPKIGV
jgi:endonuclease-3